MKKEVLVRGPAMSQSGYGEHTRFVLRALRQREDEFNIYVLPTAWGETGWLSVDDEERAWLDDRINACTRHMHHKIPFDISVQVTIPNEWERMAPINIGVTAGIEVNQVAAPWLIKANEMTKVIVVSEFAKQGFLNTTYTDTNKQTGEEIVLRCNVPVEVAHYPIKTFHEMPELDLKLDYDFNFLAVAQWGPRKNLSNLVKWFVEENHDQEVGLVLKTSLKNNSIIDRIHAEDVIKSAIPDGDEIKCKVYLLHGDMTEEEMHSLYRHPKIKAMVSLTHGEGFGLPLFEAAYSCLPVIAPGWSGQCDFLYAPFSSTAKKKKNKVVMKPLFAEVDYTISQVPESAHWKGVLERGSKWAYPTEGSCKMRLRQVRKNYNKWLDKAEKLQTWVQEEFEYEKMHKRLASAIYPEPSAEEKKWLANLSEIEVL